jgi:Peptidase_C39 like family
LGVLLAAFLWMLPHRIGARGGIPVPGRLLLAVPEFLQGDPRWGSDHLADTEGTLAGEGCAVTSAAMVLAYAGADVDPGRLNEFLKNTGGYEGRGWIRWESAALYPGANLEKAYEDLPSYALIDGNLFRGNPVIVRVRLDDGITHFVVIVGKQGFDYLIRDPAATGEGEVYPLSRLGVPMEALRFYRRPAGA